MNHTYIMIAEGIAFRLMLMPSDAVGGRWQIVSLSDCGIKGRGYGSPAEVEKIFTHMVENGIIEAWYKEWHPGMHDLNKMGYEQKVKRVLGRL